MSKKNEVNVKEVVSKMVEEGKSKYAMIKHLAELDVPVATIAKEVPGVTYQYAYNVAKSIGKVVTKPRTNNISAKIRERLKEGAKPMDIAKELNVRPQFVYNLRRQMIDRGQLEVEGK